jgi:uncharacterized protein (TIGR03437 family)
LAGTRVLVTDSIGNKRLAPLFFVSPTQVNYLVPTDTALGTATVTVSSGDGKVSVGTAQIAGVAPGLFTANADGQGVVAGLALRVKAGGTQSYEPVARFDRVEGGNMKFYPLPIDLGPESDQVYLILFGTGLRYRQALSTVSVKIGGIDRPVLYAGPQGRFFGQDQINVLVSRSLKGRGEMEVELVVDGKTANTVKISIR